MVQPADQLTGRHIPRSLAVQMLVANGLNSQVVAPSQQLLVHIDSSHRAESSTRVAMIEVSENKMTEVLISREIKRQTSSEHAHTEMQMQSIFPCAGNVFPSPSSSYPIQSFPLVTSGPCLQSTILPTRSPASSLPHSTLSTPPTLPPPPA